MAEPSPDPPGTSLKSGVAACPMAQDPEACAIICPVICQCNKTAPLSAAGAQLKQQCVSKGLAVADAAAGNRSPVKPEVNYDMTKQPPAPIMSRSNPLLPSTYLPGRLAEIPNFVAGAGMVRRPDAVVVKDVTRPPTQDNLRSVVEIKFPPDSMDEAQERAYQRIAGEAPLIQLGPQECNCPKPEEEKVPEKVPVRVPAPAKAPQSESALSKPGTWEVVGLGVLLVGIVASNAVGGEAADVAIPSIVGRLALAF